MDWNFIAQILFSAIRAGTPLLLVALGELVLERSGVLNLGQEGVMLMGAVAGFAMALSTGNAWAGVGMAMLIGALMALLFGVLVLSLACNVYAAGLALAIFGSGLSAFIGSDFIGQSIEGFDRLPVPVLSAIPIVGPALFTHDALVYLSWGLAAVIGWWLGHSRGGLMLRAIGENPQAAHANGLPVLKVRYLAVLFGGAMSGLGGAYLSLAYTPMWSEGMTAGRGWIALALVVFAMWRPGRLVFGAYLFGFAGILHLVLQGAGWNVPSNLLAMLPYGLTILALIWLSRNRVASALHTPRSLGQTFMPGD